MADWVGYADRNVGPFKASQVVVFDDATEQGAGWIASGYFRPIPDLDAPTMEGDRATEGSDRA